jgi:tryptophanyl-tRNA synthetase
VRRIPTDSAGLTEPKNPDSCGVFQLYSHFASTTERERMAAAYRMGTVGYHEAKVALVDEIGAHFSRARVRYEQLEADPCGVWEVLNNGTVRAQGIARSVIERARSAALHGGNAIGSA